jgi:hypothetical protein
MHVRISEMMGRAGGDRTKSTIETGQIIESTKRGKREKPSICLTEIHRVYTEPDHSKNRTSYLNLHGF